MRSWAAGAVIVLGLFSVALTGCGGIDTDKLEDEIAADSEAQLEGTGISVDSVTCPDDIDSETGEPFECEIAWSDDTTGTVDGEVTDGDAGDVEYSITPN